LKACLVVLQGAADRPQSALKGQTPLQRARTPHMDALLKAGRIGSLDLAAGVRRSVPETALPRLLGYRPDEIPAAGPLEAAGQGRGLRADETAFLADFVTVLDDVLEDPVGGAPSEAEASVLRDAVNAALGGGGRIEAAGAPWRNLLFLAEEGADDVQCVPPHTLTGQSVRGHGPEGPGGARLLEVMQRAQQALASHEVNQVRVDLRENPITGLWVWGGGRTPELEPAGERLGARTVVVSGPGFARGLARTAGCEEADAGPGDGEAAKAALGALGDGADLAVIVIDGTLRASLAGDVSGKVEAVERVDTGILGPLREGLAAMGEHRSTGRAGRGPVGPGRHRRPGRCPERDLPRGCRRVVGPGRGCPRGLHRLRPRSLRPATGLRARGRRTVRATSVRDSVP
jgi:2,3-bisphosphoglycerate-independent phosphoglycerate mutase